MPFYSFHCEKCTTTFDVRASIQEREAGLQPSCPKCTSLDVQQVITAGLLLHRHAGDRRAGTTVVCAPNAGSGCCG